MTIRPKNLLALAAAALLATQAKTNAEPVSAGIATTAAVIGVGTAVWSGAKFVGGCRSVAYARADQIIDSDPGGVTGAQIAAGTYATNGGWFTANASSLATAAVGNKGTSLSTAATSTWVGPVMQGSVNNPTKTQGTVAGWSYYGWGAALATLGWTVNRAVPPAPGVVAATTGSTETVPITVQYTVNPATWQTDTGAGDYMDVQFGLDAYAIPDPLSQGSAPSPSDAFWQEPALNADIDLVGGSSPALNVTGNFLTSSMFSPITTDGSGNVNAVLSAPQTVTLVMDVQVPTTLNSFSFVIDPSLVDNVQATGVPEPCTLGLGIFGTVAVAGIRPRGRRTQARV